MIYCHEVQNIITVTVMATPKRMRTHRPKHSDTSLSREWRINMANKKKNHIARNASLSSLHVLSIDLVSLFETVYEICVLFSLVTWENH